MSDVGAALAGRAAADGAAPQRAAAPKKRIAAYDIARGIAMLAVIVGHTNTQGMPATIVDFCYSFDMPLFFIISGYFCRPDARLDRGYVLKNARALLLPYALTCVILLALMAIRGVFFLDEGDTLPALLGRWTVACLYGSGGMIPNMPEGIIGVGAIWYLLALFWAKLLLAAANRSPYTPAIVLGLFVFGYVSGNVIWLPWSVPAGVLRGAVHVDRAEGAREEPAGPRRGEPAHLDGRPVRVAVVRRVLRAPLHGAERL